MARSIGIDFGTSRCLVAALRDGRPQVLGEPVPNVVWFAGDRLVLGAEAHAGLTADPQRAVHAAARLLGRKLQSPEVQWLSTRCPYEIAAAPNGDARVMIDDRSYSPPELVSFVLEHVKRDAEEHLGGPVTDAVVAVPSSFDDLQRRAVLDAARLADLEVAALVNGTTAASALLSTTARSHRKIAVVDVGAGSYEVSLVALGPRSVRVLASSGDPLLGGDDIDRRIAQHLGDAVREATGHDVTATPSALAVLLDAARAAKHVLSDAAKTAPIVLEQLGPGVARFEHPGLSRRRLVELIAEDLASLKGPCVWALEDADLGTDDFDEVLLVGGLGRMPAIAGAVKYLFRREPVRPHDADELAALGAAVLAGARHGDAAAVTVSDVAFASAGFKGRGGRFVPVIGRNQRIPHREIASFMTAPGNDNVVFELFQGECELAMENAYVGRFVVEGLRDRGEFRVAFTIDEDGLLEVSEVDEHEVQRKLPLQLSGGLTADEIDALLEQRAERAAPPRKVATPLPTSQSRYDHRTPRTPRPAGVRRPTSQRVGSTAPPVSVARADRPMEVGADALVGTVLGGRYRVDAILAEGGMGRVYVAEHTLLRKRFAIKVLHPELAHNRELAERFVSEAQAASAIQSDHVVSISDFGLLEDGTGYFVMEYLEGETLEQLLHQHGPLPAHGARTIAMQVADGLRGAHAENIVHRDLKPANIMLVGKAGRPSYCKILDFGIAKRPTSDSHSLITMVGVMVGTPHYMAPEQVDGAPVDGRCDLYSLGIVLYEMVAGVPPFDCESVAELLGLQKWGEPPPVRSVHPAADCPPALEAVILRCLEKDPAHRYQTAEELAEALARIP